MIVPFLFSASNLVTSLDHIQFNKIKKINKSLYHIQCSPAMEQWYKLVHLIKQTIFSLKRENEMKTKNNEPKNPAKKLAHTKLIFIS